MHLKGSRDKSVSFCLIFHEIVLTACGDVSIGAFMKRIHFPLCLIEFMKLTLLYSNYDEFEVAVVSVHG
jgi:hypothetical protein